MKRNHQWMIGGLCSLLLSVSGLGQMPTGLGPKFHWFDEHKDDFDIVFVGSSRIAHGIIPTLFDQLAAQQGWHWRSFNLGKDKMKQPQCIALARHVAALRPRRLRYLFLELQISGARKTAGAFPGTSGGLGPDGDGYFPIDHSMSAGMRPLYEQFLAAARKGSSSSMNSAVRDQLTQLRQELKAHGIELVFVVAPSLRAARGSGINAPPGSLLFSFDDLDRYAPLYSTSNRPDAEHLNEKGAEIFTHDLATEFLQAIGSLSR